MSQSDGRLFRIVSKRTGLPLNRKVWTQRNWAFGSLTACGHLNDAYEVQEGQAVWPAHIQTEEELRNGTEELVLALEHPDLGEQPAP